MHIHFVSLRTARSYESFQPNSTEGPKIAAALENLTTPVEGVVTTYNKPYSHADHEAINFENTKFGEVRDGHVVLAK